MRFTGGCYLVSSSSSSSVCVPLSPVQKVRCGLQPPEEGNFLGRIGIPVIAPEGFSDGNWPFGFHFQRVCLSFTLPIFPWGC